MATETVQATDHKLLVAGEWIETGEWAEVKSPYDETPVGRVAQGDAELVDRAAKSAHEVFDRGDFPQHERAEVLTMAAEIVSERGEGRRGGGDGRGPPDPSGGRKAAEDGEGGGEPLR